MAQNLKEAIVHRRTYYNITNSSPISDNEIKEIIDLAVANVPSAFNSQSTRVVLLLGENHKRFWGITKETLRVIVPPEAFEKTLYRINTYFDCGYGTILFYEDMEVVENLQKAFPDYKDNFPGWSQQTSGMHQFAIWAMLEDAGLGASLQHYNPLIDEMVRAEWSINPNWKLIAQMPFGTPTKKPDKKECKSLEERILIFK